MVRYGIPEDPSLRTSSRLRMWWLHSVRGYRVLKKKYQPHAGWFGSGYETVYWLLPRHSGKAH